MFCERYLFLTNGVTLGFFFEEKVSLILSPDGSSLVIATATNSASGEANKRCLTRYCPTSIVPLVVRLLRFRNVHAVLPYTCERFLEPTERNQPPFHILSHLDPSFSTSISSGSSHHHYTRPNIHDHNGGYVQPSPSLLLCPFQRRLCVTVTTEILSADGPKDTTTSNTYRRPSMAVAAVVPIIRVIPMNLVSPPHIQYVQLSCAQSQSHISREIFAQVLIDLEPELAQVTPCPHSTTIKNSPSVYSPSVYSPTLYHPLFTHPLYTNLNILTISYDQPSFLPTHLS